jgi:hypothetical protein
MSSDILIKYPRPLRFFNRQKETAGLQPAVSLVQVDQAPTGSSITFARSPQKHVLYSAICFRPRAKARRRGVASWVDTVLLCQARVVAGDTLSIQRGLWQRSLIVFSVGNTIWHRQSKCHLSLLTFNGRVV